MKYEPKKFTKNEHKVTPENNGSGEFSNSTELSFEEFKKSLGPESSKYTDEQIEQMRITCDRIADLFFDNWLREKNSA
ncbi:MAG: hypothetical protein AAB873_01415 [Patescibacteria group bacterium]